MRYLDLFWQTNKTLYQSTIATNTRRTEFQPPLNPLKPNGYYTYHHAWHEKTERSCHKVYLCALHGYRNKQRAFPLQHELTDF